MGLASNNPILANITDYLIEEASAEEEELLGTNNDLEDGEEGEDGNSVVRDEELMKVSAVNALFVILKKYSANGVYLAGLYICLGTDEKYLHTVEIFLKFNVIYYLRFWIDYYSICALYTPSITTTTQNIPMRMKCPIVVV